MLIRMSIRLLMVLMVLRWRIRWDQTHIHSVSLKVIDMACVSERGTRTGVEGKRSEKTQRNSKLVG